MELYKYKGGPDITTIAQKWGNSIGVRIPYKIAQEYDIVKGTEVEFTPTEGGIVMKPVRKKPTLDDLLAKCEGENPNPTFFSEQVGREQI